MHPQKVLACRGVNIEDCDWSARNVSRVQLLFLRNSKEEVFQVSPLTLENSESLFPGGGTSVVNSAVPKSDWLSGPLANVLAC